MLDIQGAGTLLNVQSAVYVDDDEGPGLHAMHQKLLVVQVR